MIEPVSHKPRFINTFLSVMVGYLMNMAFPEWEKLHAAEYCPRYEKVNFSKLLGTVVAERAVDMVSLLVLLGIVIFSQFGQMLSFLEQNPEIETKTRGFHYIARC
jgi:glycosyltransferase 2 family protein